MLAETKSSALKPFGAFFIEKHEFLGVCCYRHSFVGLRLGRRILLHFVILLLVFGSNLFAYSLLDSNCFYIDYCNQGCTTSNGASMCGVVPNLQLAVFDLGNRQTQYSNLLLYTEPLTPNHDEHDVFSRCSTIRNPL